jgi:predicted nucleic acid-binding protein
MPSVFLDSNVILYAALPPKDELRKAAIALDLLKTTDFGVSGQTLAEVYNVLSRQNDPAIDEGEIDLWVISLAERPLAPADAGIVRRGAALSRRYRIGYFDAALIAAAERLGADTFYTEDLNDGQSYGAVTARNPFV